MRQARVALRLNWPVEPTSETISGFGYTPFCLRHASFSSAPPLPIDRGSPDGYSRTGATGHMQPSPSRWMFGPPLPCHSLQTPAPEWGGHLASLRIPEEEPEEIRQRNTIREAVPAFLIAATGAMSVFDFDLFRAGVVVGDTVQSQICEILNLASRASWICWDREDIGENLIIRETVLRRHSRH